MREERAGGEEVIDKGRETATESRGFRLEAEIFLPRRRTFWRMPSMEYGNIFGEVEYRREGLNTTCTAVLFCFYPLHTAGCKHISLRSMSSLLRKHCPRPTVYNDMQCADITFVLAVCFLRGVGDVASSIQNVIYCNSQRYHSERLSSQRESASASLSPSRTPSS